MAVHATSVPSMIASAVTAPVTVGSVITSAGWKAAIWPSSRVSEYQIRFGSDGTPARNSRVSPAHRMVAGGGAKRGSTAPFSGCCSLSVSFALPNAAVSGRLSRSDAANAPAAGSFATYPLSPVALGSRLVTK